MLDCGGAAVLGRHFTQFRRVELCGFVSGTTTTSRYIYTARWFACTKKWKRVIERQGRKRQALNLHNQTNCASVRCDSDPWTKGHT